MGLEFGVMGLGLGFREFSAWLHATALFNSRLCCVRASPGLCIHPWKTGFKV